MCRVLCKIIYKIMYKIMYKITYKNNCYLTPSSHTNVVSDVVQCSPCYIVHPARIKGGKFVLAGGSIVEVKTKRQIV